MLKDYFVYILASKSRMLYTGVTNNLLRRLYQHKHKLLPGYTAEYGITRLMYFEVTPNVRAAIEREKQIKSWPRSRRVALIESANPEWKDLSEGWLE